MPTTNTSLFTSLGCLLVASIIYFRKLKANAGNKHLPPGPKPVPVLGNVRDLQAKELWLPAMNWAKQYGECHFGILARRNFDLFSHLLERPVWTSISHLEAM